jgi:hypothetical protein
MITRVPVMDLQPGCCAHCGQTPTNDDGTYKEALFTEGVDIDWGNALYTCWDCGEIIADLMGRATRGGFDDMQKELEALKVQYEALLERHEEQQVLVDKVREGVTAKKELAKT